MKLSCLVFLFLLSITSLFSQEFIKHSTVHFKDSTTVTGDFKYFPSIAQSATVVDSLGKKQGYDLGLIDYIEGKSELYRVINFNGTPKLLESIIEASKVSLYKTYFDGNLQFYVLKKDTLYWLEGGILEIKKDGKRYRKENLKYKGTLKFLMSDNTYVVNKIEAIKYLENELTPLIIAYNEGRISYVQSKVMQKQNKTPDWKIFTQYTNGRNTPIYLYDENFSSRFFLAGAEYFNSEGSRHSFKFGLEYGQFDLNESPDVQWLNLNSSYYYDFLRKPDGNVYIGVRLLDMGWDFESGDPGFYLLPRLSPLMGYEHHLSNKTDFYIELHHLFSMTKIPLNFSVGFSYDL